MFRGVEPCISIRWIGFGLNESPGSIQRPKWARFRFHLKTEHCWDFLDGPHSILGFRGTPDRAPLLRFSHQCRRKKPWTDKKNAAIIASSEVTMTFPLSSRSTQISGPSRFPVIAFEPLLDVLEPAA